MGTGGRVLVVDDQPQNVDALTQALEPLGFEVWQALDGPTALLLAKEHLPDVILLDIRMPQMDGFEVCRRLKEDPDTRTLPIVFLTGLDSREARLEALTVGATDFLPKPFDLVELEARVRNLVSYRHLIQDLDDAEQILFSVARAVETRDEVTGNHCDRLAHWAQWLGKKLGLDEESLKALRRAGYLHDMGKIGIPDAILRKPGPLTPEEWAVMRSHVEIGVSICAPLRTFRAVLPIIRHHHERRDGSGYPDGLVGDDIPFLARVFQVVDVFDALTSPRPYRAALPAQQALDILAEETRKGAWDPKIVEVFTRSLQEEGFDATLLAGGADKKQE